MPNYVQHLPKAPIIEGLIDIQSKVPAGFTLEQLAQFGDRIAGSYPIRKDLREIRAELRVGPGAGKTQTEAVVVGHRYERSTPPFVIHARIGELLVSRLKPYDTWDNLLAETRALWATYRDVTKSEAITRVATRFINRIELPLERLDFDHYLAAPPKIPKGLPQTFAHFLTRIVVPHEESGAQIAISQALDSPNPQTRTIPVLLDIDVYKELELPVDSPELWELLATMRGLKNRAFFDSVTERALELFR